MFKSLLELLGFSKKEETKMELQDQISQSFRDFMDRPIHKVLTHEIINSTIDDELIQTIYDNLAEKFPKDYKKEYETIINFNQSQQAFYVIWVLEAEVINGGFNQYYSNTKGKLATLLPGALKLVGAHHLSELVIKANSIYETENETITKYQDGTLEGFSKSYQDNPLNALGGEFYELNKIEDLSKLQVDFIRRNSADFVD